ncbi:hypothetical protein N7475_006061 [Penicillium sp. IBT 31633x]|nr:hypothetical protein N7475_006061 [Penicillium sp. IBT 31633x]
MSWRKLLEYSKKLRSPAKNGRKVVLIHLVGSAPFVNTREANARRWEGSGFDGGGKEHKTMQVQDCKADSAETQMACGGFENKEEAEKEKN